MSRNVGSYIEGFILGVILGFSICVMLGGIPR
jgi:hypothetical protein